MQLCTRIRTVVAMAMALTMVFAGAALASDVAVVVVDITAPTNSVTLAPGQSGQITINMSVTGNQAGTATFEVYRDWTLSGGTFTGANSEEFTVAAREGGDPATTFTTTGTVSVAADEGIGTFTLAVGAFDITNSNQTGGKLAAGDRSSYQVTVAAPTKQNQSISFDQPATPQPYGDTFNVDPTASSGLPVSLTAAGSCTATPAVNGYDVTMTSGSGNCVLTASQAGSASYNAAANVERTVAAQPRAITVAALAKSKTYGDLDPALTYSVTSGSLAGSDTFSGALSRQSGESVASSPYAIQQGTLTLSSNYDLTFVGANMTITARPLTGSFSAADKVYDGTTTATVVNRSVTGVILDDDVSLSGGTATFDNASVGASKTVTLTGASLTGADAGNYSLASVSTATAAILAWNAQGHGFYQPVGVANSVFVAAPGGAPSASSATVWNTAKGGSTVPLKFNVFAGDVERTSTGTDTIRSFTQQKLGSCTVGAGTDELETALLTTGTTSLRYDTINEQFVQNWATPKVSADSCYRATVTFADGSSLTAFFRLRK